MALQKQINVNVRNKSNNLMLVKISFSVINLEFVGTKIHIYVYNVRFIIPIQFVL